MTPERWVEVKTQFLRARALAPSQAETFVRELRSRDEELAGELERLLGAVERDDHAWTAFVGATRSDAAAPAAIGRYRIVRELGRGAMGVVYLAEQTAPARRVALKVIRPGWSNRELAARLEREARMLARLQHPGIAQVYEVGSFAERGDVLPYIAMELVEGPTLVEFARERSADERVELLIAICAAVQHAHQRGVLHRDLKPSNILVDAEGRPKVLDFGVARAIGAELPATTLLTELGTPVGTLPYMSPEQLAGDPLELDTRSDVYALGVIAFEVLSGALPFDLRGKAVLEAARAIRDDPPVELSRRVPGVGRDLETIVAKALDKERERRYESAAALGADLERWLRNEPIAARPATALYRLAKWTRRNRALVAGLCVALLCLAGGFAGTAWQAVRASEGERRAQVDSTRAVATRDFLRDLLVAVDPERDGSEVRVVEVLDRAPSRIEQRFAGDTQTRAWLYDTVGQAYFGLEQYDRALPVLERAVELRRDLDGLSSRESLAIHAHWAEALHGTLQLDRAGVELERSLELRRRALGESDRDTLDSLQLYDSWLDHVGRRADAIERASEGLERSRAAFGDDDELTVAFKASLAMALTGDVQKLSPTDRSMLQERALPLFEEVVRWRRAHQPDAPDTLSAIHNLAQAYWQLDQLDQAEPLLLEACDGLARTLGPDAPGTMIALGTLGSLQHSRGCLDDADASYRRAYVGLEAAWGARHPETLVVAYNLACLLRERSQLDEAAQWARKAAEGRSETLGADHPLALRAAWKQAEILRELGRRGEALAVYAALLEVAEAALPPDDPRLATYRAGRAACTAP